MQAYSLADPAPTYGGANFSATLDFIGLMLRAGHSVAYYPESAYWCNYDISVPLFLPPLYALSRVTDLQLIARREAAVVAAAAAAGGEAKAKAKAARPLAGQFLFESGWQWGYWLNNLVAMDAQWELDTAPGASALDALRASLGRVLAPLAGYAGGGGGGGGGGGAGDGGGGGGSEGAAALADAVAAAASHQHQLLVLGHAPNSSSSSSSSSSTNSSSSSESAPPPAKADLSMRTGISLLQGVDAMADLFQDLGPAGLRLANITSQPDRLPLRALARREAAAVALYEGSGEGDGGVAGLLRAMTAAFRADADAISEAAAALLPPPSPPPQPPASAGGGGSSVGPGAAPPPPAPPQALRDTLADLVDSAELLALRAQQLDAAYALAAHCGGGSSAGSGSRAGSAGSTGSAGSASASASTAAAAAAAARDDLQSCAGWLATSRGAIAAALPRVRAAEGRYGLFAAGSERLWAYGENVNPTAYGFGHLWAVHDLYYWRRDQRIAEEAVGVPGAGSAGGGGGEPGTEVNASSACFANIRNPLDIYAGDGTGRLLEAALAWVEREADRGGGAAARLLGNASACLVQEPRPPLST